jgi:hypothetical protein
MAPADALVAILFSALAAEAFINDLAVAADMAAAFGREHGIESPVLDLLADLASALVEIETDRGSVPLKYQMASKILVGHTFSRGASPFQEFRELFSLRDILAHPRPRDRVEQGGYVVPSATLVRNFQQKKLTRTPPPKPGGGPGGTPWLLQIETDRMADWAYKAACKIIEALGAVLPADTIASGSWLMKQQTQELPV